MTKKEAQRQKRKTLKKRILEDIRDVFIIIGLVCLTKTFVLDIIFVNENLTTPNKQLILVKKWNIHIDNKESELNFLDEIIVESKKTTTSNERPLEQVMKIIGKPGDTLSVINGKIYRNDRLLSNIDKLAKINQPSQTINIAAGEIGVISENELINRGNVVISPLSVKQVSGQIITKFNAHWLSPFFNISK